MKAEDPNWVEEKVTFEEYDPKMLGYDEHPPLNVQVSQYLSLEGCIFIRLL